MEDVRTKRVAIIGAGPSGLAACKHALGKGFRPVVFESGAAVGGVWTRTLSSTKLQTPPVAFRFSDFPWPEGTGPGDFPRHDEVQAYFAAYARHFGVLECVRFRSKVLSADYVGIPERKVAAWEQWSGNGEAFGDGTGEWELTVQHDDSENDTQTYKFDFLVLCVGRYGIGKIPKFPEGRGPEVFHGQVLHSMDYSRMPYADADELIRGKRVIVVGSGKSALDIAAQCAKANGTKYPCTVICRSAHWFVYANHMWVGPGGHSFAKMATTRLAELMIHKPGEGFFLSLLATLLVPLRVLTAALYEAYFKMHTPLKKHGMVPESNFPQSVIGWQVGLLPERFYDMVTQGSIQIKRRHSFSFYADGMVLNNTSQHIEADVIILATGFEVDKLQSGVFKSPWFREIIVSGASKSNTMLPLYRQCVHPRIPQMAIVGYPEAPSSIYPYEMMGKWVAHLLDGTVRLPSIAAMEQSVTVWERWGQWAKRNSGTYFLKSCIGIISTWYHDQLCQDMGYNPRRKQGRGILAEWLEPYGPADYADIK